MIATRVSLCSQREGRRVADAAPDASADADPHAGGNATLQAIGANRFVLFRERTSDVESTISRMLRGPQPARDQGEIDEFARRHARKAGP